MNPVRWATTCRQWISAQGAPPPRSSPASAHSCAILDDGTAKCWGANTHGELGQGDTDDRGNNLGDMGDALHVIDLGSGRTATAISAGLVHTCAILDDYALKCWGSNGLGQLGQGDTADPRRRDRRDGRRAARDRPRWWRGLRRGRQRESHVRRHLLRRRQVLGPQQLRPARPRDQRCAGRQRRRDGSRTRQCQPRNRTIGHGGEPGERSLVCTARQPDDEVLGSQRLGPARKAADRQHRRRGRRDGRLPPRDRRRHPGRRDGRSRRERRTRAHCSTTAR